MNSTSDLPIVHQGNDAPLWPIALARKVRDELKNGDDANAIIRCTKSRCDAVVVGRHQNAALAIIRRSRVPPVSLSVVLTSNVDDQILRLAVQCPWPKSPMSECYSLSSTSQDPPNRVLSSMFHAPLGPAIPRRKVRSVVRKHRHSLGSFFCIFRSERSMNRIYCFVIHILQDFANSFQQIFLHLVIPSTAPRVISVADTFEIEPGLCKVDARCRCGSRRRGGNSRMHPEQDGE